MYIKPIFLWSTVVTQSCNTSSQMRRGAVCSLPAGWLKLGVAWVAIGFPWVRYFRDIRYAVTASRSWSLRCIGGIRAPGLKLAGSCTKARRLAGVLGTEPEAMVSRLARQNKQRDTH